MQAIHYGNLDQKLPLTPLSETRFCKLKSSANRWKLFYCFESKISSSCDDIWTKSFDQISSSYADIIVAGIEDLPTLQI